MADGRKEERSVIRCRTRARETGKEDCGRWSGNW